LLTQHQELIKVRGFQVAPPEIEGLLLLHPDIVDCGVIGVADSSSLGGRAGSEVPRAYVVKRPGAESRVNEKTVYDLVAEKLSYYKRLDGGVIFLETIVSL